MEGNQSRRIDFVDLTKGVCIILVVMAHVGGAFEQLDTNSMLSCFRMPLYFFISGVFFKSYEGLFGFILRKINKLIIPFLFFYLSAFLMKYIVWKIAPGVFQLPVSWNELLVVFHGHDLIKFNPSIWFLLALFNCNILFYLIHFLREKHLPVMFAVTILIGCAGFYLGKLQIELPLYIDVSMTALPFYVAGFWIRRYNFFLYPSHRFDKLIPVFVVLALVVMYFTATTLEHKSNQMSGGQMQRVAIARALVNNPAVILADEATGNLDSRTSFEILVLFQKLHAEGRTIIFVTHNPELSQYSSRNIRLRDGQVIEDTTNPKILSAAEALAALPKNDED